MANQNHTIQHNRGLKTFKGYVIGLCLSLALTLLAFGAVATHVFSEVPLIITIAILAIVQLIVQVTCFLRLNSSKEGIWDLMAFIFTIFVVLIIVLGSLWIMYNLDYNMMH